jgi:hypothetical protein
MTDGSVIYPTVSLYLYDLMQGLGETQEQCLGRSRGFYRKIYGDDREKYLPLQGREEVNHPFLELHPADSRIEPFASPADGYYYPVQLGDTYALFVDYSGELIDGQADLSPQDLSNKPFLDRLIEGQTNQLIAIAGTGLATSQIASAAIVAYQSSPSTSPSPGAGKELYAFIFTQPFWLSLLAGTIASLLLWAILAGLGKIRGST